MDFYCPECGRFGTADDGCEIGERCPDENCLGYVHFIGWDWDDVIDGIDHMLGTHREFENLFRALKVAQAAVFYARDHKIELEVT